MKEKWITLYKKTPLFCKICSLMCLSALILHFVALCSLRGADFISSTIGVFCRAVLGYATCLLPFSLAEVIVITIPLWAILLSLLCYRVIKKGKSSTYRCVACILSVCTLFYTSFVFTFAAGYHGTVLEDRLGLERKAVSAKELAYTASLLRDLAVAELDAIIFTDSGSSEMQFSHFEMNRKLIAAYNKTADRYDFIPHLYIGVKGIMLSEAMTYTHISGVYTFFTGEANINTHFPDYTLPFTAAHEMSHQRGIAREDEANFMAFLVCISSDDPYLRYSGYMNLFEYVMNALYSADREAYSELYLSCDQRMIGEMRAYSAFYEKYRDSKASEITGAVNNTYLQMQGQSDGSRSYGRVVDLCVAYYRPQ